MSVVSDVEGQPHRHVEPGEMGIFARSGFIPVGYYNDPVKTAKTIVDVDGKPWLLLGMKPAWKTTTASPCMAVAPTASTPAVRRFSLRKWSRR